MALIWHWVTSVPVIAASEAARRHRWTAGWGAKTTVRLDSEYLLANYVISPNRFLNRFRRYHA